MTPATVPHTHIASQGKAQGQGAAIRGAGPRNTARNSAVRGASKRRIQGGGGRPNKECAQQHFIAVAKVPGEIEPGACYRLNCTEHRTCL